MDTSEQDRPFLVILLKGTCYRMCVVDLLARPEEVVGDGGVLNLTFPYCVHRGWVLTALSSGSMVHSFKLVSLDPARPLIWK